MKLKFVTLLVLLFMYGRVAPQEKPALAEVDRIRLAEAFRIGDRISNHVWKDWTKAPFAVLLVTPDYEFLVRHYEPSDDFIKLGYDTLLKSEVYYRKRTLPILLLATFPAIKGSMTPTIVVGQAENTNAKDSTPWVVTLLHEHFHQLQYSKPGYYDDVKGLGLAHDDQMWMLNYPFPYDRKEVQERHALMSRLLAEAVDAPRGDLSKRLAAFLQARQDFQKTLVPDDYKYFSFQFWQEGIARYTEIRIAQLAATSYRPSKEFLALKDYTPFADVAKETRERSLRQLIKQQLARSRREVVYPFGAVEALLLDRVSPRWQQRYFTEKFGLDQYFPK